MQAIKPIGWKMKGGGMRGINFISFSFYISLVFVISENNLFAEDKDNPNAALVQIQTVWAGSSGSPESSSFGSGVLISDDGWILTAKHVVKPKGVTWRHDINGLPGWRKITIGIPDGPGKYDISTEADAVLHPYRDAALLKINRETNSYLHLCPDHTPSEGEIYEFLSYIPIPEDSPVSETPLDIEQEIRNNALRSQDAKYSISRKVAHLRRLTFSGFSTRAGTSGGVYLNSDNAVIGIHVGQDHESLSIKVSEPIRSIFSFILDEVGQIIRDNTKCQAIKGIEKKPLSISDSLSSLKNSGRTTNISENSEKAFSIEYAKCIDRFVEDFKSGREISFQGSKSFICKAGSREAGIRKLFPTSSGFFLATTPEISISSSKAIITDYQILDPEADIVGLSVTAACVGPAVDTVAHIRVDGTQVRQKPISTARTEAERHCKHYLE